ncbi:hypothetical protein LJC60_07595 [Ruminococcaceae bacterium OttesenSCG-928-D13]|nr:hypothetical protein [Ruminococcaceae bacterium OttesenSCG-928-D13]
MIKLIVGSRGSGKTKQLVDLINTAIKEVNGNIVCIEKGMKLTYDLDHKCRLIDMEEYRVEGENMLYGFIAGIMAGNYDIEEIYVDGILKILDRDLDALGRVLEKLEVLNGENCKFVITVSAEESALPESVKKFV